MDPADIVKKAGHWLSQAARQAKTWLTGVWRHLASKPSQPADGDDEIMHGDMIRAGIRPGPPGQARRRKPKPIRRHSRVKVYRLKGYTTVAKVNRKRQSERSQRLLRRILVSIILVLILILLFNLYNPIKNLTEWYRIIGIKDLSDLTMESTTSSGTSQATFGETETTSSQITESSASGTNAS